LNLIKDRLKNATKVKDIKSKLCEKKVSGVRSSIFTYASYQADKLKKPALTTCKFLYQFRSMIPDAVKHAGPAPGIEKGEFIKQYMRK
jgi:hypothetical protein